MKLEEVVTLLKTAEKLDNNEQNKATFEGVYPEKPVATPPKDPFHNTEGVWGASKDSKDRLIDRILDQFSASADADKALIRGYFSKENGTPGNYTAHSPMLNHRVTEKRASLNETVNSMDLLGIKASK